MRQFPEKPFQAPKIIFKSPKLIGQKLLSYGHLLKDKRLKFTFVERANLSGFVTWKFTTKKDLNPQKQVFFLNLGLWLAQKSKMWSFLWEKVYMRKFYSGKSSGFWFKNYYFTLSDCCSYPRRIPCCIYYYCLVAGMWYLKRSLISSFNSIIYQPKKLAWV